jgi:hypothetical protein
MATCDVYWKNIRVGSGTFTQNSATISSYTASGNGLASGRHGGRRLRISITSSSDIGQSFTARCVTDNTTSLVLDRAGGFRT